MIKKIEAVQNIDNVFSKKQIPFFFKPKKQTKRYLYIHIIVNPKETILMCLQDYIIYNIRKEDRKHHIRVKSKNVLFSKSCNSNLVEVRRKESEEKTCLL